MLAQPKTPEQPVTLSPAEIAEFNQTLRDMRHEINGVLAVMVASAEMIRLRPEGAQERLSVLLGQPTKISELLAKFSAEFEKRLNISRG